MNHVLISRRHNILKKKNEMKQKCRINNEELTIDVHFGFFFIVRVIVDILVDNINSRNLKFTKNRSITQYFNH